MRFSNRMQMQIHFVNITNYDKADQSRFKAHNANSTRSKSRNNRIPNVSQIGKIVDCATLQPAAVMRRFALDGRSQ